MLLNRIENNISKLYNYYSGLIWFSMVYYIVSISIHNIVSTNPVNHNLGMVTCVIKHLMKINPLCTISQENWFSGLVSRPITNTLIHTKPTTAPDNELYGFTNLDSIVGVLFCH